MARALYRIREADGSVRIATGDSLVGPQHLLDSRISLTSLIVGGAESLHEAATDVTGERVTGDVELLAPIEHQEVWAAGVTYEMSRDARTYESSEADVYRKVWRAERPELFFKCNGSRVVGPGDSIGVRRDSRWNVPEPELGLVLAPDMAIVGYTIANDVSSREIEGANPLYLPQAKMYDRCCALGPCVVPEPCASSPFRISMRVTRDGRVIEALEASTADMRRTFGELAHHLGLALSFPTGVYLLTGTSLIPDPPFTLRPADNVAIEIAQLGELANPVVEVGHLLQA